MAEPSYKKLLADLIAFDTRSSESNLAMIDYLCDFFASMPCQVDRYYNADETKANLLIRFGPPTNGGLLLAGHTDVVPVAGQPWSRDPFKMVAHAGNFFGRGTCDMKGFIALVCDCLQTIDANQLQRPIYLVFTYDEEIGCFGAKALQAQLKDIAPHVDFALIGEPTNFELVNAHKGLQANKTRFTGKPAHSSCPQLGHSAIMACAQFLQQLPATMPTDNDARFDPPCTTFNAGTISGGNAMNIIAEHCELNWECRPLPGVDTAAMLKNIDELSQTVTHQSSVTVNNEVLSLVPGLIATDNSTAIDCIKQFLPGNVRVTTAPFVTEAGIFQQAGIPTVVFGPGDIAQAHKPDECISIEAMDQYYHFLKQIIRFCNNTPPTPGDLSAGSMQSIKDSWIPQTSRGT